MSKFRGRVNKLLLRTHYYVSNKDFEVVRDYLKELLDEKGVNENDFKEECNQLNKLYGKSGGKPEETKKQIQEFANANQLANIAYHYKYISKQCNELPNGLWIPIDITWFQRLISDAKTNFARKKKKN